MGYLEEFRKEIQNRDVPRFMVLWEEYCTNDVADPKEIVSLLKSIKRSDMAPNLGGIIETLIPLIETIQDPESRWEIYKNLFDIQTTHTEELYNLALREATARFGTHPEFSDLMRRTGLRTKGQFQGALTQMELLAHLKKGSHVMHLGAFGVGQIMELSFIRESVTVEFEKAQGLKSIPFSTALKSLEPLSEEHFFVRRFSYAEELEKMAKENPVELIRHALRDLGPMNAQEIKEELAGYIIDEDHWSRFWQNVRGKIKKDLSFVSPDDPKGTFKLREGTTSYKEEFIRSLSKKKEAESALAYIHSFTREHPDEAAALREVIEKEFEKWSSFASSNKGLALELALMKEVFLKKPLKEDPVYKEFIANPVALFQKIEILFYKKIALEKIRQEIDGWQELFFQMLLLSNPPHVREYLFKELLAMPEGKEKVDQFLVSLCYHPIKAPDLFFWCFTKNVIEEKKAVAKELEIDARGQLVHERWWEGLLLLLSEVERLASQSDIAKKIVQTISHERYRYVRELFKGASFEFIKEFLLLASKCQLLAEKDLANLRALAGVHYPEFAGAQEELNRTNKDEVYWTTEKGLRQVESRMKEIAEKEMVENSREIETARAHGDLRENAEYKFAKERRARLQGELRRRSQEFQKVRVITENDVSYDEVAIGSIIEAAGEKGEEKKITLLGFWEADPDNDIFSIQSKVGEGLIGKKLGDTFSLQNITYTIKKLSTIFGSR